MKSIAILTALLWVSPAFADDDDADTKPASKAEDEKTGEHEKSGEPEGGKFSLLSHECKAEQDELETVPGSPPLDVDDPATPGCNAWEVNIVTSGEFGKHQSWETPLLDINYGIGDNLQLKFEIPYEIEQADGMTHSGLGLSEVGLNHFAWRMASLDDLKTMHARLKDKGVPFTVSDHAISIGIYFDDPDGNGLEVYYELPRSEWQRDHPFSGEGGRGRFPGPWDAELAARR